MKTVFYIMIFIVSFLLIANMQITFKPFQISLPYWHRALGLVIIVIGLLVYNIGEKLSGYNEGFDDGVKRTVRYIENKVKAENQK